MKTSNNFKSKVAGAVKFFFMGDDEPTINSPSSATRLIDKQLDMVTGGNSAAIANNAFKPITEKKKGGASGSWSLGRASGGASGGWESGTSGGASGGASGSWDCGSTSGGASGGWALRFPQRASPM